MTWIRGTVPQGGEIYRWASTVLGNVSNSSPEVRGGKITDLTNRRVLPVKDECCG